MLSGIPRFLYQMPLLVLFTLAGGSVALLGFFLRLPPERLDFLQPAWARVLLWMAGVKVRCAGAEHAAPGRAFVLAANHRSHFDLLALMTAFPLRFRALAKSELFRIPVFGWALHAVGHIPVDRRPRRRSRRKNPVFHGARRVLAKGNVVLVFPEGTRNRHPGSEPLLPFRSGAFRLAREAGVPVLPAAILGGDKVLPPGGWFVRSGVMTLRIGRPVEPAPGESAESLSARCREAILGLLNP
jgi:1-acyl-sn-glycerol-3-phosphate acyltransferase